MQSFQDGRVRIESFSTPNFNRGRGGRAPRGVVLHTTAGTFQGTVAWFGSAESGVSAHYLVALDGRVAMFVDEADTARHAGRVLNPTASLVDGSDPNTYTIGIEFEDGGDPNGAERTPEQYAAGAELIQRAALRWGIPLDRHHIVGHREIFSAKTCPGNLDIDRLVAAAADV